jgi:ribosomal protein S18 acetylase RimI-like enzyme
LTITIRPASAGDYDDLCALIEKVDALHLAHLPHIFRKPAGPVREKGYILGLIADEDAALFVAQVAGQFAGFVTATVEDTAPIPILVPRRTALVHTLAVKQDHRRVGVGRALMHEIHHWAATKGAISVELNVFTFNQDAIAFYRNLGYATRSQRMSISLEHTDEPN